MSAPVKTKKRDIVLRLRSRAESKNLSFAYRSTLMREAANEIERLRMVVEIAQYSVDKSVKEAMEKSRR